MHPKLSRRQSQQASKLKSNSPNHTWWQLLINVFHVCWQMQRIFGAVPYTSQLVLFNQTQLVLSRLHHRPQHLRVIGCISLAVTKWKETTWIHLVRCMLVFWKLLSNCDRARQTNSAARHVKEHVDHCRSIVASLATELVHWRRGLRDCFGAGHIPVWIGLGFFQIALPWDIVWDSLP